MLKNKSIFTKLHEITKDMLSLKLNTLNYENHINHFILNTIEKNIEIKGNLQQKILDEIEKLEPNWYNNLINSPLEKGDLLNIPFKDELIHNLSLNLTLHFILIYLMFMLLIIFTSKLIIDKNIQFNNIKSYPLGNYIHYYLMKYISIWRFSANLWIYFIIFSLTFFICVSTYSIYQILSIL